MKVTPSNEWSKLVEREVKHWCSCEYNDESYAFHIPPYKVCAICKGVRKDEGIMKQDHYHCGVCSKLTQIG